MSTVTRAVLALLAIAAPHSAIASPSATPGFTGSAACRPCHADAYAAWRGSQHAAAMQHATAETVRGDFGGVTVSYGELSTTFFRRGDRFVVRTDGPDGKPGEFEVRYTFGIEPLQQYLVELPGGRLQALPFAWDTRPAAEGGQRWFHLYPDERLTADDPLHWTRAAQNWNAMCADCHSTAVEKRYDATTRHYTTTWAELTVGCEACHGPGAAHLAWARTRDPADASKGLTVRLDERRGVTWTMDPARGTAARSRPRDSEREIETCAPCHARRAQIAEGWRAGAPLLDHYLPALLTPDLFHADGQQRDEVYVWASFLQSRMYQAGVTCSDCHEPHSQRLRAEGNALCAQCHLPARYDTRAHHHHDPGTAGGQCVSCHMPTTTYMVVDPRRDHRLHVPRPDLNAALGIPDACSSCHRDRDAAWAAAAWREWYGDGRTPPPASAAAFRAAETRQPRAAADLAAMAADTALPPIVRASALERLAGFATPLSAHAVGRAARDPAPLVRLAAARLAGTLPPAARRPVTPLLGDPLRAVRIESARVLTPARAQLTGADAAAWERAAQEYLATLALASDRPESGAALGTFHAERGQLAAARAALAASRALEPDYAPAWVNAADLERAAGNDAAAQQLLEQGLARAPDNAALHHALGLLYVRQRRQADALRALERATTLAPDEPRYAYVYAVALHSYGRPADAIARLDRAAARWPGDRDILLALATMQRDAGRPDAARRAAEALLAIDPDDPDARALLAQLGGGPRRGP